MDAEGKLFGIPACDIFFDSFITDEVTINVDLQTDVSFDSFIDDDITLT